MQNKSRLRKWGKGLIIFSGITFISLVTWANWNEPTITEKLERIEMSSFDLSHLKDQQAFEKVDTKLKNQKGITAYAVNADSKMASVTFYPTQISKQELLENIQGASGADVDYKQFDMKAGCPMRATSDFFGQLKQSLCFRD